MWMNILLFLSLSVYHYVQQPLSWNDAQQYCRQHFEDLATVDNIEDLQRLQESTNGFDTNEMWIGFYDDRTSWKWALGNQDYKIGRDYSPWDPINPDFYNGMDNCTVIMQSGLWGDETVKQYSTFRLKISSGADMTDPEVEQQILEQLHVKLAEVGLTGRNISWVRKGGQVFHKAPESESLESMLPCGDVLVFGFSRDCRKERRALSSSRGEEPSSSTSAISANVTGCVLKRASRGRRERLLHLAGPLGTGSCWGNSSVAEARRCAGRRWWKPEASMGIGRTAAIDGVERKEQVSEQQMTLSTSWVKQEQDPWTLARWRLSHITPAVVSSHKPDE
ncbi:hypothetical protein CRUP_031110 [Coryphaenoides rupestris]|nr:hypothetical protein CRUP_031110 [Coryphaenoides rupestris]